MESKIIQRLTRFLDHRSSNWQQRLCLIIFLTLCLTVIVAGVPMHIMGIVGRSSGIPICYIGSDVVDDSGAVCFVYDASYVVEDSYIHIWIVDTADR